MANRTSELPGGLLIPERCTLAKLAANTAAATTSDYGEATPRPGFPIVADSNSRLRLEMSGGQGVDVDVQVVAAGNPARDGVQLAIKKGTDAASADYRTWDGPSVCTGFVPMDWGNDHSEIFDIATIPSTQKVIVARKRVSGNAVRLSVIAVDHSVTEQTAAIAAGTDWNFPALVVLPGTERIVCFYGGGSFYSDDLGATWTTMSTSITSQTTTNYGPTAACVYRGDIVLFVEDTGTPETIHHLVSTDGGMSFSLVQSTAALGIRVDCVATPEGIHVVWVDDAAATEYRKLGTAFDLLDGVTATSIGSGSTQHECTIWADGPGTIYIMFGDYRGYISASHDAGESWATSYKARGFKMLHTSDRLSKYRATYALGQAFVVGGFYDGASYATARPGVVVLGGWNDTQIVGTRSDVPPEDRWGFSAHDVAANSQGQTYFPFDDPDNQGWTNSGGTATGAVSNADGAFKFTSADDSLSFSKDLGTTPVSIVAAATLQVVAQGSDSTRRVAITLRLADASAYEYEAEILFSTTAITVNDRNSAATATASVTMTTYVRILAWIDKADETCTVVYKTPGSTNWTTIGSVALTDAGATANNAEVEWGHIVLSTGSQSDWRELHYCAASANNPELATAIASRYSRAFNSRPEAIPDMGTSTAVAWLSAVAGPGIKSETVDIDAYYDHAVDNIHAEIEPSPVVKWRSTDLTEQIFCYDLGANGWAGDSVALFVAGANFKTAYLESYNGSTWDIIETLVLADGFTGLRYTLSGDMLYPDTANTAAADRWLWEQELRGGWIQCTGATGPVTASTRILAQSQGGWQPSATGTTVLPMIELDDTSAISALAGNLTCNLVWSTGLIIAHHSTKAASLKRYWRVRIPAGTAAESTPIGEAYYEAGIISVCRVQPFGAVVEWGMGDKGALNVSRFSDARGTDRVREQGPQKRTWTIGWPGGEHRRQLRVDGADVDYHGASGGLPLVGSEDVSEGLRGMLKVIASGETPVIAVEPFPDDSGVIITDPTRFLYGRLVSGVGTTSASGDTRGTDEDLRVDTIRIEELV